MQVFYLPSESLGLFSTIGKFNLHFTIESVNNLWCLFCLMSDKKSFGVTEFYLMLVFIRLDSLCHWSSYHLPIRHYHWCRSLSSFALTSTMVIPQFCFILYLQDNLLVYQLPGLLILLELIIVKEQLSLREALLFVVDFPVLTSWLVLFSMRIIYCLIMLSQAPCLHDAFLLFSRQACLCCGADMWLHAWMPIWWSLFQIMHVQKKPKF